METLHLSIVTPQGKIFDGDVNMVTLPGKEGEFGVLYGHASEVATLGYGNIIIEKLNKHEEIVTIDWGHVKVDEKSVDVLAHGAIAIKGESESEIGDAIESAIELLRSASDNNTAITSVISKIEDAGKKYL